MMYLRFTAGACSHIIMLLTLHGAGDSAWILSRVTAGMKLIKGLFLACSVTGNFYSYTLSLLYIHFIEFFYHLDCDTCTNPGTKGAK